MSYEPDYTSNQAPREKPLVAQAQMINGELARQIRRLMEFRDRILGKPRQELDQKIVEMTLQGLPAIFSNSTTRLSELSQLIDEMEKIF
jgi:hypothetical protein